MNVAITVPDGTPDREWLLELWRSQADGLPLPVRRFVELKIGRAHV